MPPSKLNPKEQKAYDSALRKIRRYQRQGNASCSLSLGDLGLTMLPPEIGQLTTLTELYLHKNQLTLLPPEIGQLTKLVVLILDYNQLTTLPPEIGQLTALAVLSSDSNELTTLPPEIGQLTALRRLSLNNNQLTKLPPEIGQLTALTRLFLSNNQFTRLSPEIALLRALKTLHLGNNQLATLPPELRELKALEMLFLHANPALGLPDSVLGPSSTDILGNLLLVPNHVSNILNFYFALKRGAQPLHEVKLVLIGRGSVGKTSLVRALLGKPFNEQETETPGIGIGTWELACGGVKVKVHVWDFAGQEITHEAHRFFLTERCLYLVVTEGRQNLQDADADHWLAHVEQYGTAQEDGKPAQTSPALVVANKADLAECPLEKRRLKREHPCVRAFLETDCRTGRGIAELRTKIAEVIASAEMDSVRQPFPTEWQKMKERMEDWRKLKRHCFDFEEFAQECTKAGVRAGDQLALTHVLNQLGIALYYGKNPKLKDTRVLDPQWLANGMYALIRGVEKHGDKLRPGEMREDEVATRLAQGLERMPGTLTMKDYSAKAQKFLLELMEDRELCFVARQTRDGVPVYLLPGLLPTDEPEGLDLNAMLQPGPEQARVRFAYRILPDGLLPRFIVRTHPLSHNQPRWRRGVKLEWRGAEEERVAPAVAVVLADVKEKRVEVSVQGGTEKLRQELAGMVRTHLKNIHAELPRALDPKEQMELSPGGEQWEDVEKLQLAAQQGETVQVKVGRALKNLPPEKELKKLEPATAWAKDAEKKALRVFISYSHKDHKHLEKLTTTYLAVLENEGLIKPWTDGEIRAGEDWDKCIRNEMREADIVILLLSEDFFASKYIQGVECELARKRKKLEEVEIIPVVLSGTTWKRHDWLKELQLTPKQPGDLALVPLVDFEPRQAKGWEAVQEQLRKVIAEVRERRRLSPPLIALHS
jgi:small GTP-binding protein